MVVEEEVELPRRRRGALVGAIVVAVLIAGLVVVLARSDPAQDRTSDSPLVGEVAPPLTGEVIAPADLVGEQFDLDRLRGQWVLVNFFATWCVPCVVEHPELIEWSEAHAEGGDASVVSAVFDDEADDVAAFFEENGGSWPVVDGADVILDWAVAAVPESFLVSPDGIVVAKITGGVTAEGVDALLDEIQGL